MFAEIIAIMWKEWRQLLQRAGGNLSVFVLRILFSLAIFTLIIPVTVKDGAIVDYSWNQIWITIPLIIVLGLISFSFAGERETHTLPTLLASPLSDRALVLGKMSLPVVYGSICPLIVSLCLLVRINIFNSHSDLILYSSESFISGILTSLLVAIFIATLGVYTSMKAPTIRQAQTSLLLTTFIVILLPAILLVITGILIPNNIRQNLLAISQNLNSPTVTAISLLFFAIFDLMLIVLLLKWFDRDRLLTVN